MWVPFLFRATPQLREPDGIAPSFRSHPHGGRAFSRPPAGTRRRYESPQRRASHSPSGQSERYGERCEGGSPARRTCSVAPVIGNADSRSAILGTVLFAVFTIGAIWQALNWDRLVEQHRPWGVRRWMRWAIVAFGVVLTCASLIIALTE